MVLVEVVGAGELHCALGGDVSNVWASAFKQLRVDYIPVTAFSPFQS